MSKRLYKSEESKVLCGVCGGIGEYFNVDPVVIRIAWVVFCCLGGSGIIAYIIAAIIIPSSVKAAKDTCATNASGNGNYSDKNNDGMAEVYENTYGKEEKTE